MSPTSIEFILFSLVCWVTFMAVRGMHLRSIAIAVFNCVLIGSFAETISDVLPLIVFLSIGYLFINIMLVCQSAVFFWASVIVLLASFSYLKQYAFIEFIPSLDFPYIEIGLSYILFRVLHLFVDVHQRAITQPIRLLEYFNYTCFFLSFLSGPIQRYQDFQRDVLAQGIMQELKEAAADNINRILIGFIKVLVLASALNAFMEARSVENVVNYYSHDFFTILIWYSAQSLAYAFFVYFNFSGYMDIVIGIGRLLGFKLPENFDRPFAAENYLDFWQRWHMTLSEWLKTYVFNPLVKKLYDSTGQQPKRMPLLGVIGYFVTFFFVGVWHVPTMGLGIALGLGVSVNKLYEAYMRSKLGATKYKLLRSNLIYRYASRGLTISYFCISVTYIWISPENLAQLTGFRGMLLVMAVSCVCLALLLSLSTFIWDAIVPRMWRPIQVFYSSNPPLIVTASINSIVVFGMIYWVVTFSHRAPEFIYQGF
jgi:alginate O-acetyltransferase complex protein AlgI